MRRCLDCNNTYPDSGQRCPRCNFQPELIDGFEAFAPELARSNTGFKLEYFAELADLEDTNFWFKSRNSLIAWALGKYAPKFQSFLEIGCGTGYVLSGIASNFHEARLRGAELFTTGLGFASARLPAINFMQMDARNIPFVDEFDAIGAFDVLEHIDEDEQVLMQILDALRVNGIMLLTVPQHAWLWSTTDEYACHVRRYSARELQTKVECAGFEILRSTSFVSGLLPAMLASRLARKKETDKIDVMAEFRISPWLNRSLEAVMGAEIAMIRNGINFPLGGSRLIVARKL